MKILTFLLLLSIALLSCSSDDNPAPTPTPDPMPSILDIFISTSDNINISTRIKKPAEFVSPAPTIIFIHSGVGLTNDKSEWINSTLYDRLFEDDYIVVAYDIRTFGLSGGDRLTSDPESAPLDLMAVVELLKNDEDVDNSRIGVIGSRLGAEIGLAGMGNEALDLKTSVSLSAILTGVRDFSSDIPNFQLQSVFYIAGEDELNGVAPSNAQVLFEETNDPKKITIAPGVSANGSAILPVAPFVEDEIVDWIRSNL